VYGLYLRFFFKDSGYVRSSSKDSRIVDFALRFIMIIESANFKPRDLLKI
jgi:hypothetical protein